MRSETYTARLIREWVSAVSSEESERQAMKITPRQSELTKEERGRRLGEILDRLAASGIAEKFGDPVEWQREMRHDKPLIGREDD